MIKSSKLKAIAKTSEHYGVQVLVETYDFSPYSTKTLLIICVTI